MKAMRRAALLVTGVAAGLLLVEGALQLARLGFQSADASRQVHADGGDEGDLRVLCVGACYTVGVGAPADQSYPVHLERILDAELAEDGLDSVVLNRGVRGRTVDYFSARIEPLLESHLPDVLVVGVNRKMGLDVQPGPPRPTVFDALLLPKMVKLALGGASAEPALVEPTQAPRKNARTATTEMLQAGGAHDYLAEQIDQLEAELETSTEPGELLSQLANLYVARGDYRAARDAYTRTLGEGPLRPDTRLVLLRYAVALGEYGVAEEHLEAVRGVPEMVDRYARGLHRRKAGYEQRGQNVEAWHSVDLGRLALLRGDLEGARDRLERTLAMDPDLTDAHHMLLFVRHLQGEPLPGPAAATLAREEAVRSPDGFADALDAHLARIAAAAEHTGTRVVVHNFAALSEQTPIIAASARRHGMRFVDVMGALAEEPDPDRFFDPANHLRLNPEGNAWLAARIRSGMGDVGQQ